MFCFDQIVAVLLLIGTSQSLLVSKISPCITGKTVTFSTKSITRAQKMTKKGKTNKFIYTSKVREEPFRRKEQNVMKSQLTDVFTKIISDIVALLRISIISMAIALCPLVDELCDATETSSSTGLSQVTSSKGRSSLSCAMQNCGRELSSCLRDPNCAKGLSCILGCTTKSEVGKCQVRCTDLFGGDAMNELTECSLTTYHCIPPLPPDPKYAYPVAKELTTRKFDISLLRGKWYVAAGLNEAFDCFDCQEHYFYQPSDPILRKSRMVADAAFSFRIKYDDGSWFTKTEYKRIISTDENFPGFLQLILRPDRMNYMDQWNILTWNPDEYFVVQYRGRNAAWNGYGGVNVYTRTGHLPHDKDSLEDIKSSLRTIGVSLQDMKVIDNSCKN